MWKLSEMIGTVWNCQISLIGISFGEEIFIVMNSSHPLPGLPVSHSEPAALLGDKRHRKPSQRKPPVAAHGSSSQASHGLGNEN